MTPRPTALITGAAKRIGATLATHLATQGFDLVLHYNRSRSEAEALGDALTRAHGTRITLKQADLANLTALADFWAGLPPCQLIIHNASLFARGTLASMTTAELRLQLAVNFEAPLLLSQGFMAQLPAQAQGNIILLGDGTMGWSNSPEFFSYAVSKQAWGSVMDLLAASVAPHARANVVALGPTLVGEIDDDAMFARLAERAPLKRTGTPEEVCRAVDFLLTAPGVTGQVISLANGLGLASARPLL